MSRQRAHVTRPSRELRVAGGRRPVATGTGRRAPLAAAGAGPEAGGAPGGQATWRPVTEATARGLRRNGRGGCRGDAAAVAAPPRLPLPLLPQAGGGGAGGPGGSEEKRDEVDAALREAQLAATGASRAEYREATRRLARSNVELPWRQQDAGRQAAAAAAAAMALLTKQGQEKAEEVCAQPGGPLSPRQPPNTASRCAAICRKARNGGSCPPCFGACGQRWTQPGRRYPPCSQHPAAAVRRAGWAGGVVRQQGGLAAGRLFAGWAARGKPRPRCLPSLSLPGTCSLTQEDGAHLRSPAVQGGGQPTGTNSGKGHRGGRGLQHVMCEKRLKRLFSLKKEKAEGECAGFSYLEKVLEKIEPSSTRKTVKKKQPYAVASISSIADDFALVLFPLF